MHAGKVSGVADHAKKIVTKGGWGAERCLGEVERTGAAGAWAVEEVDHCGLTGGMTKEGWDGAEVGATLEEVCDGTVLYRMAGDVFGNTGLSDGFGEVWLRGVFMEVVASVFLVRGCGQSVAAGKMKCQGHSRGALG